MKDRQIIWLPIVRSKLRQFRSEQFTPEETFDYISQLVLEAEDMLKNPAITMTYKEEFGVYKGLSRIVINKFRIYYEPVQSCITVVSVLFPGEK
jgi:mRNA-degrading endonuclease RelE of RelBE toxin-antitoxin system